MFQITPGFSVPIVYAKLDDHAELNRQLRELFLEREAEGDKFRNPEPLVSRNKHLFAGWCPLLADAGTCVQRSLRSTDRR